MRKQMSDRRITHRSPTTWLGVVLFAVCGSARAAENPKPLPEKVVQAWGQAGAAVGWMGPNQYDQLEFRQGPKGKEGEVAAFRVQHWHPGMLARLPAPAQPFGLNFYARNTGQRQGTFDAGSNVTDAGLKELAELQHLQTLFVFGPKVTDAGLKELARLRQLRNLGLSSFTITNAGLKKLAALKHLQTLTLLALPITDAGLKNVAALKQLETLNLLSCLEVTDAGLKELARLQKLRKLNLNFTKVTDAGCRELRRALPQLLIISTQK